MQLDLLFALHISRNLFSSSFVLSEMPLSRLRRRRQSSLSSIDSTTNNEQDDITKSFASLTIQKENKTPLTPARRMVPQRDTIKKKTPISKRQSGLDGDAWSNVANQDNISQVIVVSSGDDDSFIASDDDSFTTNGKTSFLPSDDDRERTIELDLTAPTPNRIAAAFAADREEALRKKFNIFDAVLTDGQLFDSVKCIWSKRLRTTAGQTRLIRSNNTRTAIIELSTRVIDSPIKLESTLAHELCHAAAWILENTAKPPHGRAFKRWARKIHIHFPHLTVTTRHRYFIQFDFKWACEDPECSVLIQRHSNSINTETQVCPRCASRLVRVTSSS
mmetsp:Transcript_5613/g.7962  ORF Transcript_5613/g.7962 Transcript_5613/m.7962 type:complete len:333 (+) Transcript_5613:15-1013(+)